VVKHIAIKEQEEEKAFRSFEFFQALNPQFRGELKMVRWDSAELIQTIALKWFVSISENI